MDVAELNDFYKSRYIKTPQRGRRFVVSDLHGCYRTFKAMLKRIDFQREDQLFILGDFISRGPQNYKTLKKIVELRKDCYKVFCARGNHEHEIIQSLTKSENDLLNACAKNGVLRILTEQLEVRDSYRLFFKSLPYIYELDKFYLSHAGLDFSADAFNNYDAMVSIRDYQADTSILNGKTLIHGHVPIPIDLIAECITGQHQIINIDNGCVLNDHVKGYGNLVCLDIDSYEFYVQPNVDIE